MTTFETIILIALYLFAVNYMALAMGFSEKDNNWVIRLLIIIAALVGVFTFPAIFAVDVWNKLNKRNYENDQ